MEAHFTYRATREDVIAYQKKIKKEKAKRLLKKILLRIIIISILITITCLHQQHKQQNQLDKLISSIEDCDNF